jgi:hypothetical protein
MSWSSIVLKSLPLEVQESINKAHEDMLKVRNAEKELLSAEKVHNERCEYQLKMMMKYGVKWGDFVGYFWYFFVEGRKDDSEMALELRNDKLNQDEFNEYLLEKYSTNWLHASEDSDDNCRYLWRLRQEERRLLYELELQLEKEEEESLKLEDELYASMKMKVKSGEISEKEYDEWKHCKEYDEWMGFEEDGLDYYCRMERNGGF